MTAPSRQQLVSRLEALPAAQPLIRRLAGLSGVHLVGGSVRDLLLGDAPVDLDLVVDGQLDEVRRRLDGQVRVHDRFGTFTSLVDGFRYDVARARRERYPQPGALPEVEPAPLGEDLRRRDFTVNAIALGLSGPEAGMLQSVDGALDDLGLRRLRVLHERSFRDDPTRLLRLARYRARLGFDVESHTRDLVERALGERALDTVSGSRVGAELRLLAGEPDPVGGLVTLSELGLDRAIHPRFGLSDPDLPRRALELLPPNGRADRVALAAAALDVAAPELEILLDRLGFEASDRQAILSAATSARDLAHRLEGTEAASEILSQVDAAGPELVALAGALGPAGAARRWLHELSQIELEIDGRDLLAAGIPEGPSVGRGLRAALAAKLDGRAQTPEAELSIALGAASQGGVP